MNIFKCAMAYIIRKPVKNIILCAVLSLIFLGELYGMCIYFVAKSGEEDAFIHNGFALLVEGENLNLTSEMYDEILSIDYVMGVNNWKENQSVPVGMNNVKEYTGVEPENPSVDVDWRADSVTLLALMNTELFDWFRWEKSVSMIKGTYPNSENKGILIESRFAKENDLDLGDNATFTIMETGKDCTFEVCGIFHVDSDFQITEHNNLGEGVFQYSPYNVIFIDYEYAAQVIGFESYAKYGCQIYVDRYDNVERVASDLHDLLGEDANIFNNATNYLVNERSVVSLMKNYSFLILGFVFVIGGIIMLIILTFFASQYKRESGIFLALGCKKSRIVLQYFLSMLIVIVISVVISGIVFSFTAEKISSSINDTAKQVVSQSYQDTSYGPYITPQFRQGFEMRIEINEAVSSFDYIIIFIIALWFLLLSMVIPIHSIISVKPRFLLSNN